MTGDIGREKTQLSPIADKEVALEDARLLPNLMNIPTTLKRPQ